MKLNNLKPSAGSTHPKKRLGRGEGSGWGGTSARGHKGAKSRSGYSRKIGFEGGQMPLHRRLPKFGFTNIFRVEYTPINLDKLQELISTHSASSVGFQFYLDHGIIHKRDLIKVLGRGEISQGIEIHAHAFSASAIEAIEKAGGKATLIKK